jgi:desulfoferrodoxin (superoxide reductase-like protein)
MIKQIAASGWTPTDTDYDGACNLLDEQGYKHLGDGTFSTVFDNNTTVIKVSTVIHNMNALHWLEWCQSHPSKHVPKIGQIARYKAGSQRYFVAMIERFNHLATRKFVVDWCDRHGLQHCLNRRQDELKFMSSDVAKVKDKSLSQVIQAILDLSTRGYACQDMVIENLYQRGTDLVFVDPLTGGN